MTAHPIPSDTGRAEHYAEFYGMRERTGVLVAQPVRDDYRGMELGTDQLAARLPEGAATVRIPVLYDSSLFPWMVTTRHPVRPDEDPPVVPYHDLRTLAEAAAELDGGPAAPANPAPEDPRVRLGDLSPEESEADWTITVSAPIRPAPGAGRPDPAAVNARLLEAERRGLDRVEVTGPAGVVVPAASSRALWRARRWGELDPTETTVLGLAELGWVQLGAEGVVADLEAWWGGWG